MRTGITSVQCMNGRNKPMGHIYPSTASRLERVNSYLQCYLLLEMSNYLLSLYVNFAERKSSLKKS